MNSQLQRVKEIKRNWIIAQTQKQKELIIERVRQYGQAKKNVQNANRVDDLPL